MMIFVRWAALYVMLVGCNAVWSLEPTTLEIEIASITPADGPSAGGTAVTITGANLADVDSVTFGGVAATISHRDKLQLEVIAPPHPAGAVDVEVSSSTQHVNAIVSAAFTFHALGFVQAIGTYATTAFPLTLKLSGASPSDLLVASLSCGGNSGGVVITAGAAMFTSFGIHQWGYGWAELQYLPANAGGDLTLTLTSIDSAPPCKISVAEYSGARGMYAPSTNVGTAATSGPHDITGIAVTPRSPNDRVFVAVFTATMATFTAGAGFTQHPVPIADGMIEDTDMAVTSPSVVAVADMPSGIGTPWIALAAAFEAY